MIVYHGTPLSGPRQDRVRFVTGRHLMIPFFRQDDLGVVAEYSSSFAFDNSAYSVWKRGLKLDVEGYIALCQTYHRHPRLDWCLIPDVVDGSEKDNDRLLDRWPSYLRGVPVWHLHESLQRLERLALQFDRIALGSSGAYRTPNSASWWARMAEVRKVVCDDYGRPMTRLHGLRMVHPNIVAKVPFASADSTTAARNTFDEKNFGLYAPASAWQRACMIADRMESTVSPSFWGEQRRRKIVSSL